MKQGSFTPFIAVSPIEKHATANQFAHIWHMVYKCNEYDRMKR